MVWDVVWADKSLGAMLNNIVTNIEPINASGNIKILMLQVSRSTDSCSILDRFLDQRPLTLYRRKHVCNDSSG